VYGIDWPSKSGLSAAQLQEELRGICDFAAGLRLNTLIFQVRSACDAMYASEIEPWSAVLTGTSGQSPGFDPLKYLLEQAHSRGLEVHAWVNPFRAQASAKPQAKNHVTQLHPEWIMNYGKNVWLDPGLPEAMAYTQRVIADLTARYPLDGLHIDDYFYPYPIKDPQGQDIPFPDAPSHERLGRGQPLADWRRGNVNRLVQQMMQQVREQRPTASFSISPFGIGKPALRPPGITGFSQYDQLYADVELWWAQGWCDALVPQLYWPIAQTAQAFPVLLDHWLAQPHPRAGERVLWAGLYTSRLATREGERGWLAQEILDQIAEVRARPQAGGHVHFSLVALLANRLGLADALRAGPYAEAALPPAMPWLDNQPVAAPRLAAWADDAGLQLELSHFDTRVTRHALWLRQGGQWQFRVLPASGAVIRVPASTEQVVASSVTRNGVESARQAWALGAGGA
jgi:uncharacterized lipoprotein YddW (UPF0748 family)